MTLRATTGFWPVVTALAGNTVVTIIKLIAAITSGSSVLFSEAVHSFADTLNQALLFIGLHRSLKKPNEIFDYGYGNERFFWALLSACGIFFIGAGVTAYHGITSLLHPEPIKFSWLILGVLLSAFFIEFYTFWVAARELKKISPKSKWKERLISADPSTLAVYLEDLVAVIGVGIAGLSIAVSYYTRDPRWDAGGSLLIAMLLATVAVLLIIKNRSYLIGRSMPEDLQEEVVQLLEADPAIEKVMDFKSLMIGFGTYRIKCEVEFNGAALLRDAWPSSMRERYEEIRDDFDAFARFCADYADRITRLIGKRIDAIEQRIQGAHPKIRHIDIELN